ncbi:MAG: response regulator transcription factor [Eubacteriales bacterium]
MKILIVEDDTSIAELEKDYLTLSGYEVDIATDGKAGLNLALDGEYALVILDVMLPTLDGFAICKEIREKKNTPIIMLSAKSDDIDKIRGLGLGADDYMTKPFSPAELVARVKAHIERQDRILAQKRDESGNNKDIIRVRELEIDKLGRRVFLNGEEKIMPAKEFALLLFLAENPNIVFAKEHLFDKIWGMEAIGDTSTVTVHIRRLREKIELNPEKHQFIETIWGVGYRFKN